MATSKSRGESPAKTDTQAARTSHELRYEETVREFTSAVELLNKKDFEAARTIFNRIASGDLDEPSLNERAQIYARICERRTLPDAAEPETPDDLYYWAVLQANRGSHDRALELLDRALEGQPDSPRVLYARATVWALKGNAESAVADLRRTIALDPQARYQAVNDPDFEQIREEPSFIDIIEPTPSEA